MKAIKIRRKWKENDRQLFFFNTRHVSIDFVEIQFYAKKLEKLTLQTRSIIKVKQLLLASGHREVNWRTDSLNNDCSKLFSQIP